MVPWEMLSTRATSLFDKPSDTSRIISRSRSVSPASTFPVLAPLTSFPVGTRPGGGSGSKLMPSAASLRDCSKVSGLAHFEISLQAPAAIAAARSR